MIPCKWRLVGGAMCLANVLLLIRPKYAIPNNQSFFLFAFHWRDSADSWHSPTVSLIVYRLLLSRVELQAAWTQSITGVSWAHNMYIRPQGAWILLFHYACSSCHEFFGIATMKYHSVTRAVSSANKKNISAQSVSQFLEQQIYLALCS